jgi:glycosyltransferase involved in cell wall biosynthesis
VRDDGSSDGTVDDLRALLAGKPARIVVGENVGAAQSFLALLRSVRPTTAYAAFCDQDDIWLPGKLSRAVGALSALGGPALYCSAVDLVSADLAPIGRHNRCRRGPSFDNALTENIATGCTIVLNRKAIDLLSQQVPSDLVMHDAWCYLVVAGCGTVTHDPTPTVLYRCHPSNAVGVYPSLVGQWSQRAKRHLSKGSLSPWLAQAAELRHLYGPALSPEAARSLGHFLEDRNRTVTRALYPLIAPRHRQRLLDDLAFRLLYFSRGGRNR